MFARTSSSFISTLTNHAFRRSTVNPALLSGLTNLRTKQVGTKNNSDYHVNSKHWMSDSTSSSSNVPVPTDDVQAAREARKAEKERQKAENKAKQEEKLAQEVEANRIENVTYLSFDEQENYNKMGDMTLVMSRSRTNRQFTDIADLEDSEKYPIGSKVWVRGRLQSIRVKGGSCFIVLRQNSFHTVQALFFKDKEDPDGSKKMLNYLKTLTVESIVDLEGRIVGDANVKSCSVQTIELSIERIHAVSKAQPQLPFLVEDAARSEAEVEASQSTDRPFPRLGQELRLDNRWMDLRTPANNAIMRIQSAVCQLFRESLYSQGFMEIHTPKLIAGESESGAGVFTTDYFGTTACLAQSPQLYKQMAISADMERVFEIGPVFRAENSNTRRHLCEFTGLDLEMAIKDHYIETLEVIHKCFVHIFTGLEQRYAKELSVIREQYHSEPLTFTEEPCVVHWPDAQEILKEKGFDVGDGMGDLNGAMELALGEAVKEKYGTDFFMLDKYPSQIRPFYTMPDPVDDRFSNSYDMFIRGLEICSGAQRCHDPELVQQMLAKKGIEPGEGLKSYISSFQDGVSPHAGAGIGLERVVFLYLGLDNVRKASMF
eukprot:CAMPEP_0176488772 /NCGR_PEP_ID=MMETSP0200_2-20121128/6901_1 /TAXON_ID=947934 /ORGANISM="Chaetoceros sp., Strain GSL56" /LENGTH=600 /DNA_ID=CAMNT_0017885805 /DNA_START=303 /DNA_END=2102 /DNA_ORIENTATION=+